MEKQGQDNKKVVVFGASQSGNKAMRRLEDFNIIIEGFTDNNTKNGENSFLENQCSLQRKFSGTKTVI